MVDRVAIIANTIVEPGMSGGNRIFIECGKRWSEKGIAIEVFTSDVGRELCKDNGLAKARYVIWSSIAFRRMGTVALYLLGTCKGLVSILRNSSYVGSTIVYSSSDFWPDSIPALAAKLRNRKISWVASFYLFARGPRSSEFRYNRGELLKGFLYWVSQVPIYFLAKKFADAVFVTNEPDRMRFIGSRLTSDKVVAVRGGVDARAWDLIPESENKKYDAVFVGRFHSQKGVLELVDIWRTVCEAKKHAKLGIIGIGGLENQLRKRIADYHLEERIDLLGFMDGLEKATVLKNSRIGVYPATLDHWSMAPVELMICGLPLVTFDVPTLKFLAPRGMIRVPCYDVTSFAEQIVRLMDDRELYERTRLEAVSWAKEWDWDQRADMMLDKIANLRS